MKVKVKKVRVSAKALLSHRERETLESALILLDNANAILREWGMGETSLGETVYEAYEQLDSVLDNCEGGEEE